MWFSHWGDVPDISYRLSYPALVFCIVTPLFVILRFFSRRFSAGGFGWDDWTILASLVCVFTVNVQMIIVCEWAFGKHIKQMPPALTLKTLEVYFFAQIIYKINICLTKVSILLLYIRIFVKTWFVRTCWVIIAVVIAFTLGSVFSSIFQCTPVQYAFNKKVKGTCINLTAFWYANAAFNILSDLVIIALPTPIIKSLHLPRGPKITLTAVFAVGIFVCVTSILRITTLNVATSHLDTTWNSIGSSMWTVIESNLGVICACLPALRSLLTSILPKVFGKTNKASSYGESSGITAAKRMDSSGTWRLGPTAGNWTPLEDRCNGQTIKKTTEVLVQVEEGIKDAKCSGL